MNYKEEKKYAGSQEQLFRIQKSTISEGKGKGCLMLDVHNQSGMTFSVNAGRGLDIPYFEFNGINMGYISPCGVVAPEYFDDKGLGFLKSYTAGFMTTCGLKKIGSPCDFEGNHYGLHGNISHTPAEDVVSKIVEEEYPYAVISGTMKDGVIFGDKLRLDREMICNYRERKLTIRDKVTNEGYQKARHMILYHCNFGYPLLSPDSEIYIPSSKVTPRDSRAGEGLSNCMKSEQADPAYQEMCFYHELIPDEDNCAEAAIFNPQLNMGIALKVDLHTLTHFVQWKMMGAGDYVMGLEPANSTIDGIEDAVQRGTMKYLEPGEDVRYELSFRVLASREEFEAVKK